MRVPPQIPPLPLPAVKPGEKAKLIASLAIHPPPSAEAAPEALLIRLSREPLALFGVLGLAAVVLVHEIAEVVVILNGLRAAGTRKEPSA